MALIDVVKCELHDYELCVKFPSNDLRIGSQLVVYPSQIAFFVKGGQIFDEFEAGTYTLKTSNIPLLNNVVNIPFGGDSPFQAEVWFVNLTSKLDIKWGTNSEIQLEDPKYNIIVPVRAFGQYGMRIINPRQFLKTLMGNMTSFEVYKVNQYFKGKMLSQLRVFTRYGIELQEFSIMSINVPEDDTSLIKLKEAKDLAARLKIAGKDIYQMERSFDVLDTAANNKGVGGQMIGMGTGMGVGMGVGSAVGNMTSRFLNTNPQIPAHAYQPPVYQEPTYFIIINGQQIAGQTIQNIRDMVTQGIMNGETMVWKSGMAQWAEAATITELAPLFIQQAPPPPMPNQELQYFVFLNGQQVGGQTIQRIRELINNGDINGDTMVWRTGMAQWTKVSEVNELANLLPPQVPPMFPPQI